MKPENPCDAVHNLVQLSESEKNAAKRALFGGCFDRGPSKVKGWAVDVYCLLLKRRIQHSETKAHPQTAVRESLLDIPEQVWNRRSRVEKALEFVTESYNKFR